MRKAIFVLLLVPADALALPTINSDFPQRFDFEIDAGENGYMVDGTSDSYDNCYDLTVNGSYFAAEAGYTSAFDARGFYSGYDHIGNFEVQRSAWVPLLEGNNWARYIDSFTNTGAGAANLTVSYACNLGSDGGSIVADTYDGDAVVEAADFWAVTDDADGAGDPTLGHVIAGDGGEITPASFSHAVVGLLPFSYPVINVAAGDTVAIMFYAIQENSRALAIASAEELVLLDGIALDQVGPEFDYVVNFPAGGTPRPDADAGGPYEVDEGMEIALDATASDPSGLALTFAWDFDGDGEFDDADVEDPIFSAVDLDGPATVTVSFRATNTDDRSRTSSVDVEVLNLPPDAAIPQAPLDGECVVDRRVTLRTGAASDVALDAIGYRFEVYADEALSDIIAFVPVAGAVGVDPVEIEIDVPEENVEFWWHVRASDDDGGVSEWSVVQHVTICEGGTDSDTDTDGDTDADTDTETDTDTGTGTGADSDVDSDGDVDSDADSDSDVSLDADGGGDGGSEGGGCCAGGAASLDPTGPALASAGLFAGVFGRRRRRR